MLMFVLCIIINYTNSFSQNSDEWLKRGIDKIEAKKYFEALSDLSNEGKQTVKRSNDKC